MRVAPKSAVESFSSWVNDQLVSKAPLREELEALEEKLVLALQARDISSALMHACAIVYLDPEHQAARRIKQRCMREMRRSRPRTQEVPYMRIRWSELRDRPLSPDAVCFLSCIDGESTLGDVIKTTGMQPTMAYEVFGSLLRQGLIGLRAPQS